VWFLQACALPAGDRMVVLHLRPPAHSVAAEESESKPVLLAGAPTR
jgi:hypothetical protein